MLFNCRPFAHFLLKNVPNFSLIGQFSYLLVIELIDDLWLFSAATFALNKLGTNKPFVV